MLIGELAKALDGGVLQLGEGAGQAADGRRGETHGQDVRTRCLPRRTQKRASDVVGNHQRQGSPPKDDGHGAEEEPLSQ